MPRGHSSRALRTGMIMNALRILAAAAVAATFSATDVLAQQTRDGRGDNRGTWSGRTGDRNWSGSTGDHRGQWSGHTGDRGQWSGRNWSGDRHWSGSYWRSYPRFYSYPRYYYPPSWAYFGPSYFYTPIYPAPLYVPAPPVYEERYYIEPAPPPPPRVYREPPIAQAPPQPRVQPAPSAPPPALERMTLSAKELFEFDHATLRKPQPRLDEIADVMKKHPEITSVRITGYTDRIGTDSYNQKLSERRANAVKNYLVAKGVAASRLQAVGRGKANPVVECHDTKKAELIKCLEPNRRVEVEPITVTKTPSDSSTRR